MNNNKILKLGIPKGSLQESTVNMFAKAGYKINISSRSYYPTIDDPELSLILIRAQDMSRYVEKGIIDAGLTGKDWVIENESDVKVISDLVYAKASTKPVRWVLAVPENSPIKSVKDLNNKSIATEVMNITKKYLEKNNVNASVEFSWGATEIKCPTLVDAIVEITETGSSLRANNLRIIDDVLESTTQFIMNNESYNDNWKKSKADNIAMLLRGVIEAENSVGLLLNVEKTNLNRVLDILPSLQKPTVSELTDKSWVALNTIVEEITVRDIIPQLKRAGASGIVEYPLNKIIR